MLTIRLQRTGKKNQAQFRVVLAEKESHVTKKFAEVLGSYNPHKKLFKVINADRLNYWLGLNTDVSPTVHNLLATNGLIKDPKVKSFNIPKKPVEEVKAEAAPAADAAPTTETPATEEAKPEEAAPEVAVETPAEAPAEAPAAEQPKTEETPAA